MSRNQVFCVLIGLALVADGIGIILRGDSAPVSLRNIPFDAAQFFLGMTWGAYIWKK